MILTGREVPKINGSSTGFIALVVCLSVLIVGSLVAVFVLLRYFEPSDEDRAIRRQLSRRRRDHEQSHSTSPFTYTPSSTNSKTLIQNIGGIFGIGTVDQNQGGKRTKSGRGWIQASGDEWDTDMDGDNEMQKGTGDVHGIRLMDRSIADDGGSVDLPFGPAQPQFSSTSSIQDLFSPYTSSSTPPPLHTAVTRLKTADSFSPSSPSLLSASESSVTGGLSSSPEPYATGSLDDLRHKSERQFSTQSIGSISTRTLHTGTKFVESLE